MAATWLTAHLSRYEILCPPWRLQQLMSDDVDKWPTLYSSSFLLSQSHTSLQMIDASCSQWEFRSSNIYSLYQFLKPELGNDRPNVSSSRYSSSADDDDGDDGDGDDDDVLCVLLQLTVHCEAGWTGMKLRRWPPGSSAPTHRSSQYHSSVLLLAPLLSVSILTPNR